MQRALLLVALGLAWNSPAFSERFALLVGVGAYLMGEDVALEGPPHDVEALRRILLSGQNYSAPNVTVLLNGQATRKAILEALEKRVLKMKAGDYLLFYFSGHGTSAFDEDTGPLHRLIGPDSGALAPNDLTYASVRAAGGSIIVGRRDLRPILSKVPPGAQALVLIDACYSENSFKATGSLASAPTRSLDLLARMPAEARNGIGTRSTRPSSEPAEYPYSNVIAIVAAARNEKARDIDAKTIARGWATIDGKPHGAFSNSLLSGLSGAGDTDGDGRISYDELFRFVRHDLERFRQQPQLLAPKGFALGQSAFIGSRPLGATISRAPESRNESVQLACEEIADSLRRQLKNTPGIELADDKYNFLLKGLPDGWALYDPAGVLIESFGQFDLKAIPDRIVSRARLEDLWHWSNPRQPFNVRIDAELSQYAGYDKLQSMFRVGDSVTFRAGSDRAAYLLLLVIEKSGKISVAYPFQNAEFKEHPPNVPLEIKTRATGPPGTDYLKLVAFPTRPEHWTDWACGAAKPFAESCLEFNTASPAYGRLLDLLNTAEDAATAGLRVIVEN